MGKRKKDPSTIGLASPQVEGQGTTTTETGSRTASSSRRKQKKAKKMNGFKEISDFETLLICAEGARLLQEDGAGRPRRRFSVEEASGPPAESEVPWSTNQQ